LAIEGLVAAVGNAVIFLNSLSKVPSCPSILFIIAKYQVIRFENLSPVFRKLMDHLIQ